MIRVIRHHAPVGVLPLFLCDLLVLAGCFYLSAEILYPPSGWYYLFWEGGVELSAIAIGLIVVAMYFVDLYADVHVGSRIVLLQQICQALGVAILAQTLAVYVLRDWAVPHFMMLYSAGFALILLFLLRLLFSAVVKRVGVYDKLLFLGRNEITAQVANAIESDPQTGYRVIGFLDDQETGDRILGGVSALRAMVAEHRPSLLVVGLQERRQVMPVADLVQLRFGGLQIEEASKTFESVYQRVLLQDLSEQQVVFSQAFLPTPGVLGMARLTSVIYALFCGLFFLPLILAVALWLRFGSNGPLLIRLPRVGKDGRAFQMLRFRRDPSLYALFERFRLDALPELINVLRGDMLLVGPYPETPEVAREMGEMLPFYEYRSASPPGMTGWAQIHQTPDTRTDRRLALEYDLYYMKHRSVALDLYILIHSLKNRILRP